jgi:hypothetical protein
MFGYGFNDVPLDMPYFKGLTPRIELLRRLRKNEDADRRKTTLR